MISNFKRVVVFSIMLCLLLTLTIKQTIFATDNKISISENTLLKIATPVIRANEEYYNIKNVEICDVTETLKEDGGSYIDYFVEITGCLKYEDATELPQIQGMIKALNLDETVTNTEKFVQALTSTNFIENYAKLIENNSKNILNNINEENIAFADEATLNNSEMTFDKLIQINSEKISNLVAEKSIDFVNEINEEYIGVDSCFSVGLRIETDQDGKIINTLYMIFDGYTQDISLVIPNSKNVMLELGIEQIGEYVNNVSKEIIKEEKLENINNYNTDFVYMRTNAKDYANTYTSNAASRTCTNQNCTNYNSSIRQDTSKYNSNYSWYCCNDCANYVSQAMAYAGVPTTNTWKKDSYAWINCGALETYFTDTTNYWTKSDFASCNAGGIILLKGSSGKPYHAVMNVQNDTVNRSYSAHTNDRRMSTYNSSSYFGASQVSYYIFENSDPEH